MCLSVLEHHGMEGVGLRDKRINVHQECLGHQGLLMLIMLSVTLWCQILCQLAWTIGCLDIWSDLILSVSVSRLLLLMWVGIIQSVKGLGRTKGWPLMNKRELFCLAAVFLPLLLDLHWKIISSYVLTGTTPQFSWLSDLWTWTKTTSAFLGLQLAICRSWE